MNTMTVETSKMLIEKNNEGVTTKVREYIATHEWTFEEIRGGVKATLTKNAETFTGYCAQSDLSTTQMHTYAMCMARIEQFEQIATKALRGVV